MANYLPGVINFEGQTYRKIAHDQQALGSSALIVGIVYAIWGVVQGFAQRTVGQLTGVPPLNVVSVVVATIVGGVLGWLIGAWIQALVARAFGGTTNTGEMLRVSGYAKLWQLVSLLGVPFALFATTAVIGSAINFIGALLAFFATVIGIREAASVSTGRAVVIAIVAALVPIVFVFVALLLAAVIGF